MDRGGGGDRILRVKFTNFIPQLEPMLHCRQILAGLLTSLFAGIAMPCAAPCGVSGCDGDFHVCHNGDGTTTITFHLDGSSGSIAVRDTSTAQAVGFGMNVAPKPGETWGSVDECTDLVGFCTQPH